MYRFFYLSLFSVICIAVCHGEEDDNVLGSCIEHEVCKERGGIPKVLFCVHKLTVSDQELALKLLTKYFPTVDAMKPLIEEGCLNATRAKKAVKYYYEQRIKDEEESEHTFEEKRKLADARTCILFMVEECEQKRKMGMLGDAVEEPIIARIG